MAQQAKATTRKELRGFGLSVGTAFLALAGIFWWRDHALAARVLGLLGGHLLLFGLAWPGLLRRPRRWWMRLAAALAWFNTRLILVLLFYLVLTPIGLLLRLLGKRPLELKPEPGRDSYWIARERREFDPARCEKHY